MNARQPATRKTKTVPRTAEHWFLDAAIFARDGDYENARLAARRGLRALRRSKAA